MNVMRTMEEMQALEEISGWAIWGKGDNVQEAEEEHDEQTHLLLERHLQPQHETDGQRIGDQIGGDIQRRVGEVEGVDVDARLGRDAQVPRGGDRAALEDAREYVCDGLARHDDNHAQG